MKKERNLIFCFIFLLISYGLSLFLLNKIGLINYWFFAGMFFLGVYLLIKSYTYRSDSSLFLGVLIFSFSIFGAVSKYLSLGGLQIASLTILSLAFSFLANYLFFGKTTIFNTFLFFILLFLPLILFSFYCINLLLMILLICGDIAIVLTLQFSGKYE